MGTDAVPVLRRRRPAAHSVGWGMNGRRDCDGATRAELIASRARMAAAADEARRRLQRDLHDGAQQRLVALLLELRAAQASVPAELGSLRLQLSRLASGLAAVSDELQDIARAIHPAIVSIGGVVPAINALARRCPVPVQLELAIDRRLSDAVELATYQVVAEALTNAAQHAKASVVSVFAQADDQRLNVRIEHDGIGGAEGGNGSGLIRLKDRVEALGGHIDVVSRRGSATALHITIPVDR
jgi:signal transduction histidine kinase